MSKATIVSQMRLNVTLYVHCLPCFKRDLIIFLSNLNYNIYMIALLSVVESHCFHNMPVIIIIIITTTTMTMTISIFVFVFVVAWNI